MPTARPATRADATFAAIRRDILLGRYEPGAKLALADLQARYAVSSGVLREVLPRLAEQGLATSEPQLGFRVVTVSADTLHSLTEARVALEPMVVRVAATAGDVDYEANVLAAHHALARTPQTTEDGALNEDWIERHEAFHSAVLAGCGNRFLLEAAERLRTLSSVYRYWTAEEAQREHRDLAGEHRAICEAAVARDGDLCAELLSSHIAVTSQMLLDSERAKAGGALKCPIEG